MALSFILIHLHHNRFPLFRTCSNIYGLGLSPQDQSCWMRNVGSRTSSAQKCHFLRHGDAKSRPRGLKRLAGQGPARRILRNCSPRWTKRSCVPDSLLSFIGNVAAKRSRGRNSWIVHALAVRARSPDWQNGPMERSTPELRKDDLLAEMGLGQQSAQTQRITMHLMHGCRGLRPNLRDCWCAGGRGLPACFFFFCKFACCQPPPTSFYIYMCMGGRSGKKRTGGRRAGGRTGGRAWRGGNGRVDWRAGERVKHVIYMILTRLSLKFRISWRVP